MSELTKSHGQASLRRQLLIGGSVFVMAAAIAINIADANDTADKPTVWIELGGQLSRLQDAEEAYAPPIMSDRPSNFSPSQEFEHLPRYSFDESARVSIEPSGSHWVFSASVSYGRSSSHRNVRQQTNPANIYEYRYYYGYLHKLTNLPLARRFAETAVQNREDHFLLDFQVGKDVGLGILGSNAGTSILNFGVRFAQFHSRSNVSLKSDPDWHRNYKYIPTLASFGFTSTKINTAQPYHTRVASISTTRSFHGVGPSISWNGSAPLLGRPENSEIAFDWGINAAILFGRQRAEVQHQAHGSYHRKYAGRIATYAPLPVHETRSRTVAVPNFGGFAGLSFRYSNAKVSAGYRADLFFNAIDGGIDGPNSENRAFYGPFATISIGLGG